MNKENEIKEEGQAILDGIKWVAIVEIDNKEVLVCDQYGDEKWVNINRLDPIMTVPLK
jgi:hypothetical protein